MGKGLIEEKVLPSSSFFSFLAVFGLYKDVNTLHTLHYFCMKYPGGHSHLYTAIVPWIQKRQSRSPQVGHPFDNKKLGVAGCRLLLTVFVPHWLEHPLSNVVDL